MTRSPTAFDLALIQLAVGHSKPENLRRAHEKVLEAANGDGQHKPSLIVLPECFNSPYGVKYFPEFAEKIGFVQGQAYDIANSPSESVKTLSDAARRSKCWLIGGSIPERDISDDKTLYNTLTIYSASGDLVAIHRKVHLFDINIPGKIAFEESKVLTGGTHLTSFDADVGKFGVGICYDIRFPEMAAIAARQGCHAMFYPGAFNLTTGPLHWELLARSRAVDNQIYIGLCSPARDMTADYHAWGHSMVVDPLGKVIVEAGDAETIIYGHIDPTAIEEARKTIPVTSQRRFDVYPDVSASIPTQVR